MTRTTLLAAASVAALALSGAAQAGTITGSVGTVTGVTAAAPFKIASERTDASTATAAAGFVVDNGLTPALVVTDGTTQNYRVTFTVTNGTIAASSLVARNAGANVAAASVASAGTTANSATFIVTVTAAGANVSIDGFRLTTTLTSPSEQTVSVASTTELLAGGVATPVDSTNATALITYAPVLGAFTATSNNAIAALNDFNVFSAGATSPSLVTGAPNSSAQLATDFSYALEAGTFYSGLSWTGPATAPAVVTGADILNGGTLLVSATGGQQLNALEPSLRTGGTAGAIGATSIGTLTATAATASFLLTGTEADNFAGTTTEARPDFVLRQPNTAVTIQPGTFSATFTPTPAGGYVLGASPAVNAGAISLAGTTFIAPWASGNQAQSGSTVRISNSGTSASGTVTIALRNAVRRPAATPESGEETFTAPECSTIGGQPITVPNTGDLVLNSTVLTNCFGGFLRGDLYITVRSASGNLSAKMRNNNTAGTFETSLGRYGAPVTYP